jgi:hypothetical protein
MFKDDNFTAILIVSSYLLVTSSKRIIQGLITYILQVNTTRKGQNEELATLIKKKEIYDDQRDFINSAKIEREIIKYKNLNKTVLLNKNKPSLNDKWYFNPSIVSYVIYFILHIFFVMAFRNYSFTISNYSVLNYLFSDESNQLKIPYFYIFFSMPILMNKIVNFFKV